MINNKYLVALKQLRNSEISGYLTSVLDGVFSGYVLNYVNNNGFMGNNVVWSSGGAQDISGQKTFINNPNINYTGTTGQPVSKLYVDTGDYQLQAQINQLTNPIFITGYQLVSGEKFFRKITIDSGSVTGIFNVPYPIDTGNSVPLGFLNDILANLHVDYLNTSGEQYISGNKLFFGATVYVPTATHTSGATPLSQLDSTGNYLIDEINYFNSSLTNRIDNLVDLAALTGVSGFGGVLSIDGGSGNLFLQGRGLVSAYREDSLIIISGYTPVSYTGSFLGYGDVISGVDRQFFYYGNNYSVIPRVLPFMENNSGGPFINYTISGRTTSGFYLIYSDTIRTSGYSVSYMGYTGSSGAITNIIRGPQGEVSVGNFINSGIITGNFVNLSVYLDPVYTGLSVGEAFVNNGFTFTGYAIGCVSTGAKYLNGGQLSGRIYQRTLDNTKYGFASFTLDTGVKSKVSGEYSVIVTGLHRIGVDITNSTSGIQQLSIGLFGVSTFPTN